MALKKKSSICLYNKETEKKKKKSADQVYGKKHCVKRPA